MREHKETFKLNLTISIDTAETLGIGAQAKPNLRQHFHRDYVDNRPDVFRRLNVLCEPQDELGRRVISTTISIPAAEYSQFIDWLLSIDISGEPRILRDRYQPVQLNHSQIASRFFEALAQGYFKSMRQPIVPKRKKPLYILG